LKLWARPQTMTLSIPARKRPAKEPVNPNLL
jgi:hypothetical protein